MAFRALMLVLAVAFGAAASPAAALSAAAPSPGGGPAANGDACAPMRVHLALGDASDEMRVSWATRAAGCSHKVHFGLAEGDGVGSGSGLNASWPAVEFVADRVKYDSYGPEDLCGAPASKDDFDPPNLHSTVMTGLAPGRLYHYQIGRQQPVRRFRAPPAVGADASFTFIAYADVGESVHKAAKSPGAALTMRQVEREVADGGAELLLHVGDISYADGRHKIWDTFMELIEPYAARAPYQIAVGNHEYDWQTGREHRQQRKRAHDASGRDDPYDPNWGNYGNDSGGECGVPVSKLFTMAGGGAANHPHAPTPPFWFSYDYGSVHFATASTEHDLAAGSKQRKWLEADLAAVDRCRTPWVVLLTHRPMYVVHPHKSNRVVGEHLRKFLEPLLATHRVDLVLSGHVHAYARTCNVENLRCVSEADGGTTHVTLGCGGRKLSSVTHEQPAWLAHAQREFGFGRLSVHGARRLVFEYVSSESGETLDSKVLAPSSSATAGCGLRTEALPGEEEAGGLGAWLAGLPAHERFAPGGGPLARLADWAAEWREAAGERLEAWGRAAERWWQHGLELPRGLSLRRSLLP